MKIDYYIVSSDDEGQFIAGASDLEKKKEFEIAVTHFLNDGYKLQGGINVDKKGVLRQAVYKELEDY